MQTKYVIDHVSMARPAGDSIQPLISTVDSASSFQTLQYFFPRSELFPTSLSLDFCTQLFWGACGKVSHG